MFDSSVDGLGRLTGTQLAALVEANHQALVQHENQVLQLACAWADLHDLDLSDRNCPLIERARVVGGDGTPAVSEFTAAEFGTLQGVGMVSAWGLIAAALDLRHRLPRLWVQVQVQAGQVRAWQARRVAEATRHLSWEACADVDDQLAGYLNMVPWPRFHKILTAAIIDADPEMAAEREHRARTERTVYATQSEDGLKLIIARASHGDATMFMATINRIADILHLDGDTDPVDIRRSKAIGILAQPGRALQLLIDHQHDPCRLAELDPDEPEEDQPGGDEPGAEPPNPAGPFDKLRGHNPGPSDPSTGSGQAELRGRNAGPFHKVRERDPEPLDHDPGDNSAHTTLDLTPPVRYDPAAARPRVVLHYHLSDTTIRTGSGMVRPDDGDDPLTIGQLVKFLQDTGCPITIRPVLDPADIAPVDGYEIPQRTREAVRHRDFADMFPYGTCISASMDLDHTLPYLPPDQGGPPGQTRPGNLAPLARASHRTATHSRWQRRQPDPGTHLWKSPHGWIYLVTNHGTLNLGHTPYAHATWHAAAPAGAQANFSRAEPNSPHNGWPRVCRIADPLRLLSESEERDVTKA